MTRAKIEHNWKSDARGRSVLVLTKTRGRLTLDEITDYLLYNAKLYGQYVILLNASESVCGGCGWGDDEKQGDSVALYEIIEQEKCPICKGVTPLQYCPKCGEELVEGGGGES